jgi:hypothetical protein
VRTRIASVPISLIIAALLGLIVLGAPGAAGLTLTVEQELAALQQEQASLCVAEAFGGPGAAPPVFASNGTKDLQVDQGFDDQKDFSDVVTNANNAGYAGSEDTAASKDEILANLSRLDSEDVWIHFGHGVDDNGTIVGLTGRTPAGQTQQITKIEIINHLTADSDPPGVVFLGGCQGADLLQDIVAASTRIGVGWDRPVKNAAAEAALKAYWAQLLSGSTFGQATTAAHAAYLNSQQGLLQQSQALAAQAQQLNVQQPNTVPQAVLDEIQGLINSITADLANLPELKHKAKPALGDVTNRTLPAPSFPLITPSPSPTPSAQPSAVGGISELLIVDGAPPSQSPGDGFTYIVIVATTAGALAACGWCLRRRFTER